MTTNPMPPSISYTDIKMPHSRDCDVAAAEALADDLLQAVPPLTT